MHNNVEVTRKLLNEWDAQYESDNYYNWVIELKSISEPIGSISVVRIDENISAAMLGW